MWEVSVMCYDSTGNRIELGSESCATEDHARRLAKRKARVSGSVGEWVELRHPGGVIEEFAVPPCGQMKGPVSRR